MELECLPDNAQLNLSRDALRRLVIGLVLREQQRLRRNGSVSADQVISGLVIGKRAEEIDDLELNEAKLGFDSLATLDLILAVNRFFDLGTSGVEDYLLIRRRIGDWLDLLQHHRRIAATSWRFGFETSGSSGEPKCIWQTADTLWTEMRAQAAGPFAHLSPPGRVISLVPPYHIYGFLFGCVLPDLLGMDVVDLHFAAPGAVFRHAQPGDLVVGTPHNWEILRKTGQCFCDAVNGVTAAGPMRSKTWEVIRQNNLYRLTEIFGSTETGGIGSRTDPEAPFQLLPHLEREGRQVSCRKTGERLALQDRLVWESPDLFRLEGRLDHMVQVAGMNVSPQVVRHQLDQVPGVAEAAVRLGKDRLKAFVVPTTGQETGALERRILAHVNATLEAPARPGSYTYGPQLPRNAMGKLTDWS